jgi:pilus assembly protein CpaB
MGAVRIVILVVAAAAAIGLAVVVRQMTVSNRPVAVAAQTAAPAPSVEVLTASRDLKVGTRIAPADLAWRAFPVTAVNHAWITSGPPPVAGVRIGPSAARADTSGTEPMQQVAGAYVHEPIFEGQPILARQIVRGGAGGYMSVALEPGMRAVALPVTAETGVGGFVLPGDRVDVVLTRKTGPAGGGGGGGQPTAVAETVLRNLRVLGVDQNSQPRGGNAMVATSVTLEVPAGDVETLLAAKARGELILDLRSYADIGGAAGRDGPSTGDSVRFIRAGEISEASAP